MKTGLTCIEICVALFWTESPVYSLDAASIRPVAYIGAGSTAV
jgi:hypothetical protein